MYYYLSDGKNYVADNEMKPGEYILTTYIVKAKKFTYKTASNAQYCRICIRRRFSTNCKDV